MRTSRTRTIVSRAGVLATALSLLGVGVVAQPNTGEGGVGWPPEADAAIEARDWPALLDALAELPPDGAPGAAIPLWRAMAHEAQGEPEAALGVYRLALQTEPASLEAARGIARMLAALNRAGEAEDIAERFGYDSEVLRHAGHAELLAYFPESARDDTLPFAQPRTDHLMLARAIEYLSRATLLDPDDAEAAVWHAHARYENDEPKFTEDELLRAIALAPAGFEVYALLGKALASQSKHAEAARAYQMAAERTPFPEQLRFDQHVQLVEAGRGEEAIAYFEELWRGDTTHRTVRYWLGRAAYDAQRYDYALWALNQAWEVDGRVGALYYIGRTLYDSHDYASAVTAYEKLVDAYEERDWRVGSTIRHWHGRALWMSGQRREGLEMVIDAHERSASNSMYAQCAFAWALEAERPHDAIRIAQRYGEAGFPDEAMEGIKLVIEKFPVPKRERGGTTQHRLGLRAIAEINEEIGRHASAAEAYSLAGLARGPSTSVSAGWSFFHAGNIGAAEGAFSDHMKHRRGADKRYGALGMGTVAAHKGEWEVAERYFRILGTVDQRFWQNVSEAGLAVVGLHHEIDVELPPPNPMHALMFVANGLTGSDDNRGLQILALLPGSPLASTTPPLLPDDVILSLDGRRLTSYDQIDALVAEPLETATIELRVKRDRTTFSVFVPLRAPRPTNHAPATEATP